MDIKTLGFDPQQSLLYASTIAKPRLVGTDQEKEIGQYIAAHLEASGFQVRPEEFHFSDIMSVFLIFEILLSQVFIILTIWLNSLDRPLQFVTALLLIIFLFLANGINRLVQDKSLAPAQSEATPFLSKLIQRIGKNFHTINYVAQLPDPPTEPAGVHLTLVAHYDTKSQRLPLVVRIALFTLGIGSELLFAIFILLTPVLPALSMAAMVIGVFALLFGIPLLFLDLGNESPGAIDNASSVGIVLHLAEVLAHHPEICHQLDLTILLTSAEEISTIGALAYVRRHGIQLRQQAKFGHSIVLNFDGIGVDGPLFLVGRDKQPTCFAYKSLFCLIRQACIDLKIELKRFNLPGALYDHIPFTDIGMDACTLIAINRKSLSVHTHRDTVEQLDLRGFQQAGQVVLRMIDALLEVPKQAKMVPDIGIDKFDIYKNDPVMRFLRDKMKLTPKKVLLAAFGMGIADLLIAGGYNLWKTRDGIIGALQDPPYLLTIFVIIPLFLYTYIWMPDGLWCLFQSLPTNYLIKHDDIPTYRDNVRILVERYNRTWFYLILVIAIIAEISVIVGNAVKASQHIYTYNAYFPIERLVLIRIPYGFLALYGATSVIVRWMLNSDWNMLFKDVEPQVHPLHHDMAAGYGSFADCIINMMGIFIAIATFLFTFILFDYPTNGAEVLFKPQAAKPLIILSTVVYLVVGFIVFLYMPSRAARRAINQAKNRQSEIIAGQYNAEQKILLEITEKGANDPQTLQLIKVQVEKLKLLTEASTQIESIPSSPLSRRLIRTFGLSYILIYLPIITYNLLRAFIAPNIRKGFEDLLQTGSPFQILEGLISILFTGQL